MWVQRILSGIGLMTLGALAVIAFSAFDEETNQQKLGLLQEQPIYVSPPIPRDVTFCNEPLPMNDPETREMLEKHVILHQYNTASMSLMLKRSARWKEPFLRILREEGVPDDFFYLMVAESAVDNARSYAGAQGFWQFMRGTASEYGLEVNDYVDERNDPVLAARAACAYLKKAYRRFGNWTLVAASYNMGMGGVNGEMTRQGRNSYYDLYLNKETAAYVFRIVSLKLIMENPAGYGFRFFPGDLYEPLPVREVEVTGPISSLHDFARQQGTTFKKLKWLNQWLLGESLPNPRSKRYVILLPADSRPVATGN